MKVPMMKTKTNKKITLLLAIPMFCIILFGVIVIDPSWPTKSMLCRDVEMYIPRDECLELKDKFAILDRAFPIGSTSSSDVKSALGDYLDDEYQTENGHIEIYHLNNHLMDYLISRRDDYIFTYDEYGNLRRYDYMD